LRFAENHSERQLRDGRDIPNDKTLQISFDGNSLFCTVCKKNISANKSATKKHFGSSHNSLLEKSRQAIAADQRMQTYILEVQHTY
jgi:hypothetical protein